MYSCFSFISSTTVLFFLKKIIVLTIVFVICHPPFSCMAFYLPGGLHTNHKDFWKYCLLQFWLLFVVIFFSADKFLIPVTIFFPSGTLTVLWKSEVNWLTLPAFNMLVFFFPVLLRWCLQAFIIPSGEACHHWKQSALILSAHFFLISWFVSLGNWILLQPVYLISRQQNFPFVETNPHE